MNHEDLIEILTEALESIQPAENTRPGEFTTIDMADAWVVSSHVALKRLKALHRAGVVEPVMVEKTDIWGIRQRVKGWKKKSGE